MMRIGLALILTVFLTGCVSPPQILPLTAELAPGAELTEILVATSRKPSADPLVMFDSERSAALSFADIAVSVPPQRPLGKVVYPKNAPNPAKQFVPVRATTGMAREQFLSRLNARLETLPREERIVFIFVHGYNTDFAEGLYRQVQIMHDFEVPGVAVNFSWPSAGKPALYLYDRDSVEFARDGLVETLRIAADSKAESIQLVGHSMGALLTMKALRSLSEKRETAILKRIRMLVLAAPDIDVDVFGLLLRDIDPLPANTAIFVSRKDRALQASGRLRGGYPRVGQGGDIEDLRRAGITVLDLSGEDSPSDRLNHNTFATSPTLIALARSGFLARESLKDDNAAEATLTAVSDLLAGIIYLPANAAGVR